MTAIHSISDIKHAFYINLESRRDRKIHVEQQLASVGLPINRFNAIRLANGALGCSMSHLKCLQLAKAANWPHVLICEDDIKFLNTDVFEDQLDGFLSNNTDLERAGGEQLNSVGDSRRSWDVILIAGNNMPPYRVHDDFSVQVSHCQTTTGYIVKQNYYDKLIQNIKEGIHHLMMEPHKHMFFAIDKYWLQLQKEDKWFLIVPLTVVQRVDYSDIERRMTNYTRVMTDLNKDSLMNQLSRARRMHI